MTELRQARRGGGDLVSGQRSERRPAEAAQQTTQQTEPVASEREWRSVALSVARAFENARVTTPPNSRKITC